MPKFSPRIISLDTETTGVDLYHGAKPFLVTTCDESGENTWWEWAVDPLTRQPEIPLGDLDEILQEIEDADLIVMQNPKFDVNALWVLSDYVMRHILGVENKTIQRLKNFPWDKVRDTLMAGHLLASNHPHDLTSMAVEYLGVNVQRFEDAIEQTTNEARRWARSNRPEWRIAQAGLSGMPSTKSGSKRTARGGQSESPWKSDMWLPRAAADDLGYPEDHRWRTDLVDYANSDSAVTLPLYLAQEKLLNDRGLWRIYEERLRLLPIAHEMESRGVTVSKPRMVELRDEFSVEAERAGRVCMNIARGFGVELDLPKSGNNKALKSFVFDNLGLPATKTSKKTGEPSLDRGVLDSYEATLPPSSKPARFITTLKAKRKRDTALQYMEGYEKFWINVRTVADDEECGCCGRSCYSGQCICGWIDPRLDWFRLHPSLNPTGTDTLRWSSSNPNEQNISKQEGFNLRYCFGPAPGREWWSCDAKNIELRIPAYESGEQELIDLFERPDDPPYYGSTHLLNFHTVYPDIWDRELAEVGFERVGPYVKKKYESTWYKWVKNGGFAVQYGAVERADGTGAADLAFRRPGSHARLKSRFGRLEQLNRGFIEMANRMGYVETIPDREVDPGRGYPLMCSRSNYGDVKPTVPFNYHVQSTAMWWMQRAMVKCQDVILGWRSEGFDAFMTMQVHDELVFDLPYSPDRGNLPRVQLLKKTMESCGDGIGIPTPVSIEHHPVHWGEGVTVG